MVTVNLVRKRITYEQLIGMGIETQLTINKHRRQNRGK